MKPQRQSGFLPALQQCACLLASAPFSLGKGTTRPSFLSGYPPLPLLLLFSWPFSCGKAGALRFHWSKDRFPSLWSGLWVWREFLLPSKINVSKNLHRHQDNRHYGYLVTWVIISGTNTFLDLVCAVTTICRNSDMGIQQQGWNVVCIFA